MPKINRTVKRALDILRLLQNEKKPLTTKEISRLMDIPITSAFDIIQTLLQENFIESENESSKAYRIGTAAFEVGASYLQNTNALQIITPYAQQLMQLSNSTSFFALAHGNQIIYMYKCEAPTSLRTTAELGSRKAMYSTGLGKAILACYDEVMVRKIFAESDIIAYTPYTITKIDELLGDLAEVRLRGYAIDNQENDYNISCVACAIRDLAGTPIGAISIAGMSSAFTNESIHEYGTSTAQYAKEISGKLGYSGEIY